jgi:hypothetical protein
MATYTQRLREPRVADATVALAPPRRLERQANAVSQDVSARCDLHETR